MFKKIMVAIDNSPFSNACCDAAVSLARVFNAEIVGNHVYAARMHEKRFRQMEATLPDEYLVDKELERQRTIHDSLIALGLQLISNCYLDTLERQCIETEVPFSRKTFDGKNWEKLVEDINTSDYNLVVMGARGHGNIRTDSLGSVCLRVIRRTRTDTLVLKDPEAFLDGAGRGILVALDGSQEAFGALQAALVLAKAYDRPVEAVASYDPYFHYAVFHSMVSVLSQEAARVFRFKEQERLHEEIIDAGLARLYQAHLDVAQKMSAIEGVSLKTTLLAGRAADELLAYAQGTNPWLLLFGRIGVHSREEMDIGSVTEHLIHFASCNLLVASSRFNSPLDVWSQSTLKWTQEAETTLGHVPIEYRSVVRLLVHRLASEQGHSVVTAPLIGKAVETLRPPREEEQHMKQAAFMVAAEVLRKDQHTVYLCPNCGYASKDNEPVTCPVCHSRGKRFLVLDHEEIEAIASAQGGVQEEQAFDGVPVRWARAALKSLTAIHSSLEQNRARLRIEKAARRAKLPVITLEFALRHLRTPYVNQEPSKEDLSETQQGKDAP